MSSNNLSQKFIINTNSNSLRHFLITDFLYPTRIENKIIMCNNLNDNLENFELTVLDTYSKVSVVYYCERKNKCIGRFLITTNDFKIARKVTNIITNYFFINSHFAPDSMINGTLPLWELDDIPNNKWREKDILKHVIYPEINDFRKLKIFSGVCYYEDLCEHLKKNLPTLIRNESLCEALNYLSRSLLLYDTIDTKLYEIKYGVNENIQEFSTHYLKDFEESYFAAFKGIEAFFGQKQIKLNTVNKAFKRINYKNIFPSKKWYRKCMEFCKKCLPTTYQELLKDFVKIRNRKVSHANSRQNYIKLEDLCKIQNFLNDLVIETIYEEIMKLNEKNFL